MDNAISFEECLRDRATFELASTRAARSIYVGNKTALCKVANRFKMYVPTTDLSLAPHLMLEGYWESWITVAFYRLVKAIKPGTIVNVGANLGYYSFLGASLAPSARIVAYEPQPELAALIHRSALVNGFAHLTVCQRALGSQKGAAWLRKFGDFYGSAMVSAGSADAGASAIAVEIGTLDTEGSEPVEFLFIDAEGYEYEILRGGERRIRESPKTVIVLEFSATRYSDKGAFVRWLDEMGFVPYLIAYDGSISALTIADLEVCDRVLDLVLARGYPDGLAALIQDA